MRRSARGRVLVIPTPFLDSVRQYTALSIAIGHWIFWATVFRLILLYEMRLRSLLASASAVVGGGHQDGRQLSPLLLGEWHFWALAGRYLVTWLPSHDRLGWRWTDDTDGRGMVVKT